jgi:hypothetical protein
MKRAVLLATALATAACRQLAGIQDLPKPCGDPLMIDDMEDGNLSICPSGGRHGAWYGFGDGTSSSEAFAISGVDHGPASSRRAAHFTGSGFTMWGAILGFDFKNDNLSRQTYDARSAGGVTFWMKSQTPLAVQLLTPATVLLTEGGGCEDNVSPSNCNDHFAFQITAPDSAWKQYNVPFSALRQSSSGTATWDPSQLLGLQFLVGPNADFDVWVDDVAFYYCATPECLPTCTDPRFSIACPKTSAHLAGCYPTGTTCSAIDGWCSNPLLLDDMENGDNFICQSGGRQGQWYVFGDHKAQLEQAQIPGGRGDSNYAARLTGAGLSGWGAGMGFGLKGPPKEPYDASAENGINFWMRGTGLVLVQFRLPATTPIADTPGTCTNEWDCDNHFHFGIDSSGDEWVEYRVPFAALRQGLDGTATWDPSQLLAIEFSVQAQDFDVWVDDVSFFTCAGDACVPTCHGPDLPVACPASASLPAACWPAGTDCANPLDRIYGNAVWGSGPNDVWIAGLTETGERGATLHWNGIRWTSIDPTAPAIWGLWGSGPNDVWTTGVRGSVHRWTGSEWSAASSATTSTLFQGAWGSGPSDIWAAGAKGTIVHWNGGAWSALPAATDQDLWGLWGSGPGDVWAVGTGGTILRWTGSAWVTVASGTTLNLDGVWGSGTSDVWAVGDRGVTLRWNGSTWSSVPSGTTRYLDGVWGSGPTDVWAVGEAGTIAHWNGSAWTSVPSGTTAWLASVWGSSARDVWITGANSTILHFDGRTWMPITVDGITP